MHTKSFKSLDERFSMSRKAVSEEKPEPEYDEYDEDYPEEEYIEKRSMFIPMLSGVVIVTIIIAVVFLAALLSAYFNSDGSDYKEFHVDDFTGYDYEYVKREYSQLLNFAILESKYSDQDENTILSQDIEPGTVVKPGHEIKVTISKGPQMINIPSVDTGFTMEQAEQMLKEKFTTSVRRVYSDTVPEGYVIKTEPKADTPYKEGATVIIYVSRGKVTTNVTIPDVHGKKEAEARQILEDQDLVVKIITTSRKVLL